MAENAGSSFEESVYVANLHEGKFSNFEFALVHDFDSFSEVISFS